MPKDYPSKNSKALTKADTYKTLVSKVSQELLEFEFLVKRRTAEAYWRVGKFIHEHLLAHKERAEYGATLYERLAKDVGRDRTTLQRSVQFYRAYPIRAERRELTWEHYRNLITIKDEKERRNIEEKAVRGDWNSTKLREYLNVKREFTAPDNSDKAVPQLSFTRGRPYTYRIIEYAHPKLKKISLRLDLGFKMRRPFTGQFKKDDSVEILGPNDTCSLNNLSLANFRICRRKSLSDRKNRFSIPQNCFLDENYLKIRPKGPKKCQTQVNKTNVKNEELFTYKAQLNKVIDADTLVVDLDTGLMMFIEQKLRLRGIDCPEIDTEEGRRAKRFVESRLKDCDFIVVKTYKDRSDKFDRYLADVFYLPTNLSSTGQAGQAGASDPSIVAAEGRFLNQELLDEGLARPWP